MSEYTVQRFLGRYAITWNDHGKRRRFRLQATDRSSAEAEARQWWKDETDTARTVGGIVDDYIAAREQFGMVLPGQEVYAIPSLLAEAQVGTPAVPEPPIPHRGFWRRLQFWR